MKLTIYTASEMTVAEAVKWAEEIDGNQGDMLRIVVNDREWPGEPVGVFCDGCEAEIFPGIRWPTATNGDTTHDWVERCDLCERYESDEDAREGLKAIYGESAETEFVSGEAVPIGSENQSPYFDGPNHRPL